MTRTPPNSASIIEMGMAMYGAPQSITKVANILPEMYRGIWLPYPANEILKIKYP